ncbi:MAG: hypothetical protein WA446_17235 [Steroidobacteraceae bacterium]
MTASETSTWSCVAACVLGAASAAGARGEFCGAAPPPGFDQSPNRAHTGQYLNQVYGYSVAIPAALSAYTRSGEPERGFGIVLSWTPRAYLSVDAAYDAYYDITAEGVHRRDINAIRLHDLVIGDQASNYSIDHAAGGRYVTRVQCAGDPRIYIHDDVIIMRNREIYRLNLQSVPERYATDVKVLNAMLRSWRWQAIRKSYVK